MELSNVNVSDIKEYARNPREHSDAQIQEIAKSIQHFGWKSPILVDSNMTVISGHGRLKAAKLLGFTQVPVVNTGDISEADRAAYVIADNRLAEKSTWSLELLKLELDSLKSLDFKVSLTGFDIEDQIASFEPVYQPTTNGYEITENDVAKAENKPSIPNNSTVTLKMMCPHCAEEFEYSGT